MVELGCFYGIDWFIVVVGCFSSFNELVKTEQISWPFIFIPIFDLNQCYLGRDLIIYQAFLYNVIKHV